MTRPQINIKTIIEELQNADSENQIIKTLSKIAIKIGCSQFQYLPTPDSPNALSEQLLRTGNYDAAQKEIYQCETSAIIDPARHMAIKEGNPVFWRRIFLSARGAKERELINKLRADGIKDGLSIPIHGPLGCIAILNLAAKSILEIDEALLEDLSIIALIGFQKLKKCLAKSLGKSRPLPVLTNREIECLEWVLEGKTNWEIGVLIGVSARTVQFHLGNCQIKLNAQNRIQAAVQALIHGLIKLPREIPAFEIHQNEVYSPKGKKIA